MKYQSPVTSHQSFLAFVSVICLAFVSFSSLAQAVTISNKYVNVEIDTPVGITQFNGATIVNDFYFIGKATSPTTTFDVKYKVTLTEAASEAGCVLVAPVPAADTEEKHAGGLVVSYTLEGKVKGEKKIEGNIYFLPVEIKVNETAKEEDDFVAVSKGEDEDLATDFSVKLTGTDGVTAALSVKAGDGDIKFKDTELAFESGKEVKTKLWGITPSSDRDKTIIEITLTKEYKELGKIEENVTVFEGVKVEFKGTFVANVNSMAEGWRPNNTENPIEFGQDVRDYTSRIYFQDGDQGGLRRDWTEAPEVLIKKVETITPNIILTKNEDPLHESQISMLSGRFEPGALNPRQNEHIYDFKVELRESKTGDKYGVGEVDNVNATKHYPNPDGDYPDPLADWTTKEQIEERINIEHSDTPFEIRGYYIDDSDRWITLADFTMIRQQWKNSHLVFSKSADVKKSIAMKGILGSQEIKSTPEVSIRMDIERYNIWYLSGDIKNGIITTGTLPK
jgi:hypothetical protein